MRFVFVSNYFNHHQKPLCDALHKLTDGNFMFVATLPMREERKRLGYDIRQPEYVKVAYQNNESFLACQKIINEAQVVIFGGADKIYIEERIKLDKLILYYYERLFKKKKNALMILLLKIKYHKRYEKNKNKSYLLCAGAYTAYDFSITGAFRGRAYKWGYFPEAKKYDIDKLIAYKRKNEKCQLLWVGRMIDWKHPDSVIALAQKLKENGCCFDINLIGAGTMEESLTKQISEYNLNDYVHILGAMPPSQVREYMEKSNIYLFTSDRQEGWGAVLNEAMNSGCAIVANKNIGSVPYLLEHRNNGLVYETQTEFYDYVRKLLFDVSLCEELGKSAYQTIINYWNADIAAQRLLTLVNELDKTGRCDLFEHGPCSKA